MLDWHLGCNDEKLQGRLNPMTPNFYLFLKIFQWSHGATTLKMIFGNIR